MSENDDDLKPEFIEIPTTPSEPPSSATKEPPIWRVWQYVPVRHLHLCLNSLAGKGYQVRDIIKTSAPASHKYLNAGDECYHVIAFDAARLMKKQSEDMQAQMHAIMASTMPSSPMSPTGVPTSK